ncbi:MAG: hypothetical protein KY468_02120 [Armatimonadetes bacterium]|nr:hypothetical protein [Armatimonadota bacterium]
MYEFSLALAIIGVIAFLFALIIAYRKGGMPALFRRIPPKPWPAAAWRFMLLSMLLEISSALIALVIFPLNRAVPFTFIVILILAFGGEYHRQRRARNRTHSP